MFSVLQSRPKLTIWSPVTKGYWQSASTGVSGSSPLTGYSIASMLPSGRNAEHRDDVPPRHEAKHAARRARDPRQLGPRVPSPAGCQGADGPGEAPSDA